MENLRKLSTIILIALVGISLFSCKNNNEINPIWTPSQILSSTAWETTAAKNEKNESIALTDNAVSGNVGFAYFRPNGTFSIYTLQDSPRIQGDWSVSPDGKTRTLIAKDLNGNILFTRVVEITVLTTQEFTYRVYPNGDNDKSVYYDIIHTPTTHAEPAINTKS